MYADDTTLYFNIEDFPLQSRKADINNELKKEILGYNLISYL